MTSFSSPSHLSYIIMTLSSPVWGDILYASLRLIAKEHWGCLEIRAVLVPCIDVSFDAAPGSSPSDILRAKCGIKRMSRCGRVQLSTAHGLRLACSSEGIRDLKRKIMSGVVCADKHQGQISDQFTLILSVVRNILTRLDKWGKVSKAQRKVVKWVGRTGCVSQRDEPDPFKAEIGEELLAFLDAWLVHVQEANPPKDYVLRAWSRTIWGHEPPNRHISGAFSNCSNPWK